MDVERRGGETILFGEGEAADLPEEAEKEYFGPPVAADLADPEEEEDAKSRKKAKKKRPKKKRPKKKRKPAAEGEEDEEGEEGGGKKKKKGGFPLVLLIALMAAAVAVIVLAVVLIVRVLRTPAPPQTDLPPQASESEPAETEEPTPEPTPDPTPTPEPTPPRSLTTKEGVEYIGRLSHSALNLKGESMEEYKIFSANRVVLVMGLPCMEIDVYNEETPSGQNVIKGRYFLTRAQPYRLFQVDIETEEIRELPLSGGLSGDKH